MSPQAEDINKKELFETMPISQAVLNLCIPTIVSSLVTIFYNLADTYFVGILNDPVQNAAVTLAYPVMLSLNAINNLFAVGAASMISRALGARQTDMAKRISAFGFYCALICGIGYSLIIFTFQGTVLNILGAEADTWDATQAYLFWTICIGAAPSILNIVMANMVRAEGASLHASIGTMSGCLLNIILDPFFILPQWLGMGAAGAGAATCISNCVACVYFFILIFVRRRHTVVCLNPKKFSLDKKIITGVCGVGIPAAIQNLLNVTGYAVLNNLTVAYGTTAVAAMGIAQKLNMIPIQVGLGIGQGMMPLIGYNYSSGNIKRMKQAFIFTLKIGICTLTAIAAVCFIFSGSLVSVFMKDAEVVAYGSVLLRGFCLAAPFLAVDFMGVGLYQSCGMGKRSLAFAVCRKIVLEIPFLFILNKIWPLYGLSLAQTCTEIILSAVAAVTLIRLFRKLENGSKIDSVSKD